MADLGMTIVTVVHQPRYGIFILFDEVLVLGKAGRTVYQGPSAAALPYFNSLGFQLPPNENPADFCLDVVSGSIQCQTSPDFRPEVGTANTTFTFLYFSSLRLTSPHLTSPRLTSPRLTSPHLTSLFCTLLHCTMMCRSSPDCTQPTLPVNLDVTHVAGLIHVRS